MNITIRCEVIIPKKLEPFLEQEEPISMHISPVRGNRAEGAIRLVCKDSVAIADLEGIKETSFIIRIGEVFEDGSKIANEQPTQSFFSNQIEETSEENLLLQRIAQTIPTGKASQKYTGPTPKSTSKPLKLEQEIAKSAVRKQQNRFPDINSYEELINALEKLPGADQELPEVKPKNGVALSRQEAMELERKMAGVPRLMQPVYLTNCVNGNIEIADLGIILGLKQVVDISKVPARKLLFSRHLRDLIENGGLKFATENNYKEYLESQLTDTTVKHDSKLKIGNRKEVRAEMFDEEGEAPQDEDAPSVFGGRPTERQVDRGNKFEITENDLKEPVVESEIADIIKQLPAKKSASQVPTSERRATPSLPHKTITPRHR